MVFIPPSLGEVENTARDAVATLNAICGPNANFFFVGSFACRLYGDHVSPYMSSFRSPNDVDIVVGTVHDQEELKRRMVQHNPKFFLVDAKTPGATYKVLKHGYRYSRFAVKVDVLVANVTLDIPGVPLSRIRTINGFPTCPLAFLILLRLQAWDHHRVAIVRHLHEKAAVDQRDLVHYLLPYAARYCGEWATAGGMMKDAEGYLPAWFMEISRERARKFVDSYPSSRALWEAVGAGIPRPAQDDVVAAFNRLRLYR